MVPIQFEWHGQHLWLSPGRCLFWEEKQTLVLSDFHIGKAAHFRKAGIAIPQQVFQADLLRFFDQVNHFCPKRIVITGDLFHSHENLEHAWFAQWIESMQTIDIVLVKGNHEILNDQAYEKLRIRVITGVLYDAPFAFSHTMPTEAKEGYAYFTGHLHPGIKLSGKGKQSMVFPCFHFTEKQAVLPAFSKFTGKYLVEPAKHDDVFAVVGDAKYRNGASVVVKC